jgi:hypothetical protein
MQRWDLTAATGGTRTGPRVLFSTPEARGVVMDLAQDENPPWKAQPHVQTFGASPLIVALNFLSRLFPSPCSRNPSPVKETRVATTRHLACGSRAHGVFRRSRLRTPCDTEPLGGNGERSRGNRLRGPKQRARSSLSQAPRLLFLHASFTVTRPTSTGCRGARPGSAWATRGGRPPGAALRGRGARAGHRPPGRCSAPVRAKGQE